MQILSGCLMAAAGLFMLLCGLSQSDFIVYRLMVARSKMLWGKNTHRFYQVAGLMVIVYGALVAFGYIGVK